jgi:hypothetical protein
VATVIAAIVACTLLLTIVLPAEFGRDPIGTGRALGLLALYEAGAEETPPPTDVGATATTRPRVYNMDTWTLELGPHQAFEYKYRLEKGAGMVYAWKASGPLKYEFHGEADDRRRPVVSYEKNEGSQVSGGLVADFTGIHGWYWDNPSDRTVAISIKSAGFFSSVEELRPRWDPEKHKNRIERIPHPVSPVE